MPRFAVTAKVLGSLLLAGSLVACVSALAMQFHIENTESALYEAAVGDDLLAAAWTAAPAALVAVVARRRAVAFTALVLGAGLLLAGTLEARVRMDPEAGVRSAAAAFVPPSGTTAAEITDDRYDFPSLRRTWRVRGDEAGLCDAASAQLSRWAGRAPARSEDGCSAHARRGDHEASVQVRATFADPTLVDVSLHVTRRT